MVEGVAVTPVRILVRHHAVKLLIVSPHYRALAPHPRVHVKIVVRIPTPSRPRPLERVHLLAALISGLEATPVPHHHCLPRQIGGVLVLHFLGHPHDTQPQDDVKVTLLPFPAHRPEMLLSKSETKICGLIRRYHIATIKVEEATKQCQSHLQEEEGGGEMVLRTSQIESQVQGTMEGTVWARTREETGATAVIGGEQRTISR